jgi:hypothetical protein
LLGIRVFEPGGQGFESLRAHLNQFLRVPVSSIDLDAEACAPGRTNLWQRRIPGGEETCSRRPQKYRIIYPRASSKASAHPWTVGVRACRQVAAAVPLVELRHQAQQAGCSVQEHPRQLRPCHRHIVSYAIAGELFLAVAHRPSFYERREQLRQDCTVSVTLPLASLSLGTRL